LYARVVISAHIQHNRIFADRKSLVVVHALTGGGKQSEMQMSYTRLRQQRAALRVHNNRWEVYYLVEAVWQLILFFLLKFSKPVLCVHVEQRMLYIYAQSKIIIIQYF
jgi:hypothetical protein